MQSDSSLFEDIAPDIDTLHFSHSNFLVINFSALISSNQTVTSPHDPYKHITEVIVYKYICLSIFIIGLIGNFLSVLVFSRPSLRHRSCAIYFFALAITDIVSLCASFIDTVLPSYNTVPLTTRSLFICKLNPLMVYFTSDLSNFLLAVASLDRAVSIQYPLESKQFCRARIAIIIISVMSLVLLIINGHIFWGFEIYPENSILICSPSEQKTIYLGRKHAMKYDRFYAIFDSLDMLFAVVIPFIVMLICNIIILIRVLTSRRSITAILTTTMQSKKSRKRYEKDKQLTIMLLGSAAGKICKSHPSLSNSRRPFLLAFLVFTLPTEINDTVRAFRPPSRSQPQGAMALMTAIFIAMGQLNHAIHFYIYTLTGRVFRNELFRLFTPSEYAFLRSTKSTSLQTRKSSSIRGTQQDQSLNHLSIQKSNR